MRTSDYPFYETTVFRDFKALIDDPARRFPDRVALSWKSDPGAAAVTTRTYPQVREQVRALGTGLIALGLRDRHVALVGEPSYDWICSYFALMAIGAVVVPLDRELAAEDLTELTRHAECQAVIFGATVQTKAITMRTALPELPHWIQYGEAKTDGPATLNLSDLVADGARRLAEGDTAFDDYTIDPDRLATIVFTSGTTGKGKGVMLTQNNIALDMTNGMYLFAITPKTMLFLPLHHTFGSTVNLVGHYVQGSEIFLSSGLRYIAQEIREQKPSHLILVPLFVEKLHERIWSAVEARGKASFLRKAMRVSNVLLKVGIDLRRRLFKEIHAQFGGQLQMIISGGAALRQEIIDDFTAFGLTIMNGYGITECAPLVTCNRNEYQKKGSVGRSILHQEIRIADPDANGEGEICVKGPNVMLGYWKNPEATAEVFDPDGFFRTGDYGRLDADGWLYITGRLKNLILFANGKNVYPEELEAMIAGIPGVSEVVVYAGESQANREREIIVAEIYSEPEKLQALAITDPQAYFEHEIRQINTRLPVWKAIGHVRLRDSEFPKNTSRKIKRFQIDRRID